MTIGAQITSMLHWSSGAIFIMFQNTVKVQRAEERKRLRSAILTPKNNTNDNKFLVHKNLCYAKEAVDFLRPSSTARNN